MEHWLEGEIAQWVHHEGSIRRPIAPCANALTTTAFGCVTVTSTESDSPAQDRYSRLTHFRAIFRTANSTASQMFGLRRICSHPVISRLRQTGLLARRSVRCNILTAHHLTERPRWCQEHILWRRVQCRTVLSSGEPRFMLFRAD